jgi:hypothetical protein
MESNSQIHWHGHGQNGLDPQLISRRLLALKGGTRRSGYYAAPAAGAEKKSFEMESAGWSEMELFGNLEFAH